MGQKHPKQKTATHLDSPSLTEPFEDSNIRWHYSQSVQGVVVLLFTCCIMSLVLSPPTTLINCKLWLKPINCIMCPCLSRNFDFTRFLCIYCRNLLNTLYCFVAHCQKMTKAFINCEIHVYCHLTTIKSLQINQEWNRFQSPYWLIYYYFFYCNLVARSVSTLCSGKAGISLCVAYTRLGAFGGILCVCMCVCLCDGEITRGRSDLRLILLQTTVSAQSFYINMIW